MVGEHQILTAGVQVDGLAQMGAGHGAALDVPAGAAVAPGAFPVRLAGLGGLPHREISGVLLQIVIHLAAQLPVAALQIVQLQVAQLAVVGIGLDAEIHIAVAGHVGVAGLNEVADDGDDLLDMLGGAGTDGGLHHVEALGILDVLRLELAGHLQHGDALLLALLDELVVNVGDVGHKNDLVAPVLQIAAQRVKDDHGAGVADVYKVVHGGAADVDAVLAGGEGDELLLLAGHGVKNFHRYALPLSHWDRYFACAKQLRFCHR